MRTIKTGLSWVLAIGLLAGPSVGVAAQDEAEEPVQFTASFLPSSSVRGGTTEMVGDHIEERGYAWAPVIMNMSDARLDGRLTYSSNVDTYTGSGGRYELGTATYRIETDDGAWEGSAPFFHTGDDFQLTTVVLVGEGDYEGLYAVVETDWSDINGVIFPAPPPEAPTAP